MNQANIQNISDWNAFVPNQVFRIDGAAGKPLSGLTVAVKDLYDIANHPTGAGNPSWLNTHPTPVQNAPVIDQLLNAGASIVGKTITEEIAYSLVGENFHYGTPVNPHNPDCIPGGSSSGSAVATAANLCDIGLGTDTAGSIRLPASFCGIWGFRPSHDNISKTGIVPLAPSFDTVGWMTRNAEILAQVGQVLLPDDTSNISQSLQLLCPSDAWNLCSTDIQKTLEPFVKSISSLFTQMNSSPISKEGLVTWQNAFRIYQGYDVWKTHQAWIKEHSPIFGPGIKERFEWASTITETDAQTAKKSLDDYEKAIDLALTNQVLCIPTVSYLAPQKGHASSDQDRTNALCLLSISSIGKTPQITMPLAKCEGKALGLSLISRAHTDQQLLALGLKISKHLGL